MSVGKSAERLGSADSQRSCISDWTSLDPESQHYLMLPFSECAESIIYGMLFLPTEGSKSSFIPVKFKWTFIID